MNRYELQAMIYASSQLLKLVYSTKECSSCWCVTCSYNAICEAARLTHKLLEHQDIKLMRDTKVELKDDND